MSLTDGTGAGLLPSHAMNEVMVIDDDEIRAEATALSLTEHGVQAAIAQSVPDTFRGTLVVLDRLLGDRLPRLSNIAPVIVTSASGSIAAAVRAIQQGAANYLELPVDGTQLAAAIEQANQLAPSKPQRTLANFPLIGESHAMQGLKDAIRKSAPTQSTVLVLGQSGTGKELVARALHAASERATAPLISINCATVPPELIEQELFGTETPTDRAQPGLVDAANGGTLFLDEIAELPSGAQARLLRVLNGEHRRVGSAVAQPVDIRLIAATHQNLAQRVQAGHFREDLYYRLNVVCLEIPPLRERVDDIMPIASWLLERSCKRLGKQGLAFAAEVRQLMLAYHWPGNVRELENAIERAVILSDDDGEITQQLLAIELSTTAPSTMTTAGSSELTSLEDYFVKFVQEHQDNLTETELAEKLGISRKSLWERRQRLNIPRRKTRKRGRRLDQNTTEQTGEGQASAAPTSKDAAS